MMNDRELLELAAKAAGIVGEYYCGVLNDEWVDGIIYIRSDGQQIIWNPITDDGDALRLSVKLSLAVVVNETIDKNETKIWIGHTGCSLIEPHNNDPYAATRRAIVRAAAEIGKEMK